MAAAFTFRVKNLKTVNARLNALAKVGTSPKTLKVIGAFMKRTTQQTFRGQADPVTKKKWAPLAASTQSRRRKGKRRRRKNRILIDTTRLRQSLQQTEIGNVGQRLAFVRQRTNRPGAASHQEGATIKKRVGKRGRMAASGARRMSGGTFQIPQRRFLGLGRDHRTQLAEVVAGVYRVAARKGR